VRHADVLLTSRMLQARLQREGGDPAGALRTLEAALPQRLARSGSEHVETATLLTNLGVAYVQAGQLDQGIEVSRRALERWDRLQMGSGSEALNTLNNLAAAHYRQGDMEAAEATFARALELRRELFGPSAATAALIGNYARVVHRQGRLVEALALCAEGEVMALAHSGSVSPLTQALRITRGEVLLALRRVDEARAALDAVFREDLSGLPATLRLRATLGMAEAARLQDDPAAAAAFDQAQALADALGTGAAEFEPRLDALRRAQ